MQELRLAALESELHARLSAALEDVAAGKRSRFFTTAEFNPHGHPEHMLSAETAALGELADDQRLGPARLARELLDGLRALGLHEG
jgi:hypothetical protein